MDNTVRAFKMLAMDIFSLFYEVLYSDVGINTKVGINTLKDSRLAKTATMEVDLPFIKIMVNDYILAIENGVKRYSYCPPISDLRDWARRKGIPSDNNTLYAIQQAIWRDGIKGRPIIKTFYEMLDKEWEDSMADILFESIITNLMKYFNT